MNSFSDFSKKLHKFDKFLRLFLITIDKQKSFCYNKIKEITMLIQRDDYIKRLDAFRDQDLIKIVTGLRRSGKSTLFNLYIDHLKKDGIKASSILYINFEDPNFIFNDSKELYDYVIQHTKSSTAKHYLFFDEIQTVPDFQKAINGLRLNPNFDIYITGSNAYLLSGELATLLSGRYIEIHMLPLSFKEYLTGLYPEINNIEVLKRKINLQQVFLDYLNYGGLPQTLSYYENKDDIAIPNVTNIRDYLENIFSTVVYKDIMLRHNVTDKALLERIVKFVLDNIGQPISVKKIVDTLNANQAKTSFYTVENYLTALQECFLIYKVDRYDVRGRELLSTGFKYYVADLGLRNYLLGRNAKQDIGQMIENIVYLELARRRFSVQIGKYDNLEVDFIAHGADDTEYIQVSADVSDSKTMARELEPLSSIRDNYPKRILSLGQSSEKDVDGVRVRDLMGWLLD